MKRKVWIDVVQLQCPFCVNHLFPNSLLLGMDVSGSKIVTYAVETERPHARFMERVTGKDLTPFSLVLEEEVFLNRRVWNVKFSAIGTFNEYMNYVFKKRYLNIEI